MKNSTITYNVTLCLSLILPFVIFKDFNFLDQWVIWYYSCTTTICVLAIITTCMKDQISKHVALPILSVFVLLVALFNLFFGTFLIVVSPAAEFIGSGGIPVLNIFLQIALVVYAIKHILPQKIESPQNIEDVRF